ncbi:MAG: type IV secretory system conjugative DNA transfer family protein, partial [Acidobacteria bacterium]|nr:type IV secretory system conjugative DNA transfer family protein [Acidobacteriota bacterium]
LVLARAALPQERRYVVNVFIDEVQDYLALPTDLEDAFSQARSLGVGFTIAHQYRKQLPPSLRSGVDANARNKIIFGLNSEDAADLAKQAPELDMQDFMYLPRFGIYTTLLQDGSSTGWFSARTLPADAPTSDPVDMRARSAQKYGRDILDIEAELRSQTGPTSDSAATTTSPDGAIGRRRAKGSPS